MLLGRCAWPLVAGAVLTPPAVPSAAAQAEPARPRASVLIDSSSTMLVTPAFVLFPETCSLSFNPCTFSGNPLPSQEACNACVRDTINFETSCAMSWDASCRGAYAECYRAVTGAPSGCAHNLNLVGGVATRGDGSDLTPGCDLNGNGLPDDSRLYQAKQALRQVVAGSADEIALWRWAQVEGGQACGTDVECPDTPGGLSLLTCEAIGGQTHCALDAALLDLTSATAGQCDRLTWNGASASFACASCDFSFSYDRASCEAFDMGNVRTGGVTLLGPATVNCALPTTDHPFITTHGAVSNGGTCDPDGGERLVDFPAPGSGSNQAQIDEWLDHAQPSLDADVEVKAFGLRPVAAALRDMRAALLATLGADARTPCREYKVVLLLAGQETCESPASAVAAAAALQDLSFTNPRGVAVANFDVPVHVVGFAACPPSQPNCPAAQEMNAIASAGGTGGAVFASTQAALQAALASLTDDPAVEETACDGLDDDFDGLVDEGFADGDGDAVPDCRDNCPSLANVSQADADLDQVGDVCDNCPLVFNPDTQGRRAPRCQPRW
jgi:hypothetical protein